eukprot:1194074-Prorocentrum_minimum.AAC.2
MSNVPESRMRVQTKPSKLAYDGKDTDYTRYNKGVLFPRAIRTRLLAPPNTINERQQQRRSPISHPPYDDHNIWASHNAQSPSSTKDLNSGNGIATTADTMSRCYRYFRRVQPPGKEQVLLLANTP